MRILKSLTLSLVMFALMVSGTVTSFGQTKESQNTKCVCDQVEMPIKKSGKKTKKNKRGKKRKAIAPPVKIVYVPTTPAPTPTPVTATGADYSDMVVDAGNEGNQVGSIELSSGNDAEDAGTYLNVSPSPNLQAWFNGLKLHVFSPNGGNGRVIITDKNGRVLDTVIVTGAPAAATATDANIAAIAQTLVAVRDTLNQLWWIILIGFILVIIILLLIYFRLGVLKLINSAIEDIYNRLNSMNDRLRTTATNTTNILNDMDEIMRHYSIRRTPDVIDAESEEVVDPDRPGVND